MKMDKEYKIRIQKGIIPKILLKLIQNKQSKRRLKPWVSETGQN
jgi:hypothetical protein